MAWSAVQYVTEQLKLPVVSIAGLADLLQYLRTTSNPVASAHSAAVQAYRDRYGV
jgi:orotate phosphoribosyltransferase